MKNKSLLQSFKNAFNGCCQAFITERNMKVHMAVAAVVIVMGILLRIETTGWIALTIAIGLVFICELINTAIEKLTDMVTGKYSEQARRVKDISASAVMVSALVSVIIGLFVFLPPIVALLRP